eukprot:UN07673
MEGALAQFQMKKCSPSLTIISFIGAGYVAVVYPHNALILLNSLRKNTSCNSIE